MGTRLPESLCAHRKGAIEKLINGRARETAAQPQILFGKPTGDHDGPEELLVKLLTSFTDSLCHVLMNSCEDCEVSQIPYQVRYQISDRESRKRRTANNRRSWYKKRIQEAPYVYRTTYFGHHSYRSYSGNKPSQNPLSEARLLSFSSKAFTTQDSESYPRSFSSMTISTQDSKSSLHSFSSMTISTQYTSSCPSPVSSVGEGGEETVQSNSPSCDLLDLKGLKIRDDSVHFQKAFEGVFSAEKWDLRIQHVLGHFQRDFEGGVSAENLGAKFGGYGSFLPTYPRSPVRNHPRTPAKVHNSNAPTHIPKQSTAGGHAVNKAYPRVWDCPGSTRDLEIPKYGP